MTQCTARGTQLEPNYDISSWGQHKRAPHQEAEFRLSVKDAGEKPRCAYIHSARYLHEGLSMNADAVVRKMS